MSRVFIDICISNFAKQISIRSLSNSFVFFAESSNPYIVKDDRIQTCQRIHEHGQRSKGRCNGPEYILCIFCAGRAPTIRSVNPCTPAKPEDDARASFYA